MIVPFVGYSFRCLFFARGGHKLLLLAVVGLFLSSFSLLVLQSTMGGLQRNLQLRSKAVSGHGHFVLKGGSGELARELRQWLEARGIASVREYQIELLARRGHYLSPLVMHGVELDEGLPAPLQGVDFSGLVLGGGVARQLRAAPSEQISLISPAHLDPLLGGLPRQVSELLSGLVFSDVPEVDALHGWVRASLLHNLIQGIDYNRVRLYQPLSQELLAQITENFGQRVQYYSWEQINETLVKALRLETTVMIGLFGAMAFLVAISISSGLFLFYQKIQREMLGLWIMGTSEQKLEQSCRWFIHLLVIVVCGGAIIAAIGFLQLMAHWSPTIMPEIFVDRELPIDITWGRILVAFGIPYGVAVVFSQLSLFYWKHHQQSYLSRLRGLS